VESGQGKILLATEIGGSQAALVESGKNGMPLFGAAAVGFSFGRSGCLHGDLHEGVDRILASTLAPRIVLHPEEDERKTVQVDRLRSASLSVHRIEGRPQLGKSLVDDLPDIAKRMPLGDAVFEGDVAEDGLLIRAFAAQRASPLVGKECIMSLCESRVFKQPARHVDFVCLKCLIGA